MDGFLSIIYWMILVYIGLSLIVLFFILTYKQLMLRKLKNQEKRQDSWRKFFEQKNPLLLQEDVERLKNTEELLYFTKVLQTLNQQPQKEESIQEFIYSHVDTWVELGNYYSNQSLIMRAYFAWGCKEAGIRQLNNNSEMIQLMQRYALFPSIYCRNNALGALYSFGNVDGVIKTYQALSEQKVTFNARLVAAGLADFTGDKRALADVLYDNFSDFGLDFQVGIIDFFRKNGGHLKHQLADMLKDPSLNIELVCALMRYYGKHPVQEVKPIILSWMSWKYRYQWEIIAVTASTLASYPGEDTVELLKKCLQSDNWFIRKNAAVSLEILNEEVPQLEAVLSEEHPETIDQLTYDLASKEPV